MKRRKMFSVEEEINLIEKLAEESYKKNWYGYLKRRSEKRMKLKMKKLGLKNQIIKVFEIAYCAGFTSGFVDAFEICSNSKRNIDKDHKSSRKKSNDVKLWYIG